MRFQEIIEETNRAGRQERGTLRGLLLEARRCWVHPMACAVLRLKSHSFEHVHVKTKKSTMIIRYSISSISSISSMTRALTPWDLFSYFPWIAADNLTQPGQSSLRKQG